MSVSDAASKPAVPSAQPARLSTAEGFVSGALAACVSATVTNPAEVAKTRLQLDGELQSRTSGAAGRQKVYKNAFDALAKTWRYEGLAGVQRGLGAAYAYQIMLNGSRLGFYEPIRRRINRIAGRQTDAQTILGNLTAGALSGVVGAILGNPLFLVKARMQAYSPSNPVGAQHYYANAWDALRSVYRAEGFKGLCRGMDAAMLRTSMGSSVQLPAYNLAKSRLAEYLPATSIWTYLAASTFSGACVCLVMQPADTALTRMYNQSPNAIGPDGKPRGLLYKNPIDCLWKTLRAEGVRGWYKGSTAHLMRIAPHTIITLVVNEGITQWWINSKMTAST
ncbi:uncharacterized protein L969DRAFT_478866 [Mixia osmundae IAM 14324]|uniref:Mitochondrial carrier n=1 Tax=Mixia osmundae (strain CBS 9802 / IAM 14324 / JCM 22182 / KY 12970) TaxID=764103 RepID=G7E208_MIXOS|nr:uncharacterized protein L969DRAFT_478866 [Mixia osmundae IAM 14324]KEI38696.1 hypothetical protein L969DRAFT_478866 [Mixia osmundae IAM 14324]GAA96845.1 hypothetical protein E5Q_03518 [Mixia osmundae IAM 14324]